MNTRKVQWRTEDTNQPLACDVDKLPLGAENLLIIHFHLFEKRGFFQDLGVVTVKTF